MPADVLDNRCTLYISSCDAYSDLWEPFFTLFNKYWPDCPYPIVLASETKTFSYPGLNIRCPRFYKPGEPSPWGERNIRTLQSIDSPFIFFMLEDFFLFAPTDQPFIDRSVDWMENDPDIGKFQWRRGSWISKPGKYAPYGLVSRNEYVRVCAFPALWRRDTLIKSMRPRESPWEWEKKGTIRSKTWREKLYDTPYYPIKYPWGGVLWHGKWCKQGGAVVRINGIPMDFSRRGMLPFKRKLWPQDAELIELYKEWQAAKNPPPNDKIAKAEESLITNKRKVKNSLVARVNPAKGIIQDNRCTLYISSCDAYSDLWEPFFTLLAKYWPDCPYPIVLASETKTFSYPGLDIQCPRFYKPGEPSPWGERNIRTLESINSPFIFFMLEDFFIFQPVNQSFMDRSLDWMRNDPMIGEFQWRGNMTINPPDQYAPYGVDTLNGAYRVSAFPAIWRRDLLIRSMRPKEDPWKWELAGTIRSRSWPEQLYNTSYHPIKYPWGGAIWRGKWNPLGLNILRINGIDVNARHRGIAIWKIGNKKPLDDEIIQLTKRWKNSL